MATSINVQFTAIFECELHLQDDENIEAAIGRGEFQHETPELLLYRTFELDDDGEPHRYGRWIKSKLTTRISKLRE